MAANNEVVRIRWDGTTDVAERIETIAKVPKSEPHFKFNDAKVDSQGQLWIGMYLLKYEQLCIVSN